VIVDASLIIDAVADPGPPGIAARDALAAQPAAEPLTAPGHFAFEILIEGTPWIDVHRPWMLARGSLRYADAVYAAAAERYGTALLTADARIGRSGAPVRCEIITVVPAEGERAH